MINFNPIVWTFYDFVYPNGTNPVEDWYQGLSEGTQQMVDTLLKDSHKTELSINWIGFKRFLKGKYKKKRIWELAFRADKRQYRILGVFGKESKQAILLVGCYHKQQVYTPTDALDLAFKRSKALSKGEAKLHERKITKDI